MSVLQVERGTPTTTLVGFEIFQLLLKLLFGLVKFHDHYKFSGVIVAQVDLIQIIILTLLFIV